MFLLFSTQTFCRQMNNHRVGLCDFNVAAIVKPQGLVAGRRMALMLVLCLCLYLCYNWDWQSFFAMFPGWGLGEGPGEDVVRTSELENPIPFLSLTCRSFTGPYESFKCCATRKWDPFSLTPIAASQLDIRGFPSGGRRSEYSLCIRMGIPFFMQSWRFRATVKAVVCSRFSLRLYSGKLPTLCCSRIWKRSFLRKFSLLPLICRFTWIFGTRCNRPVWFRFHDTCTFQVK